MSRDEANSTAHGALSYVASNDVVQHGQQKLLGICLHMRHVAYNSDLTATHLR